jgi:hypothetical protein
VVLAGDVVQLKLTHVLPPISTSRFAHLCRTPPGDSIRLLPTLTRSYPRRFTLITRTARCSRQLPYLRCRLPARFPIATCSKSLIPVSSTPRPIFFKSAASNIFSQVFH